MTMFSNDMLVVSVVMFGFFVGLFDLISYLCCRNTDKMAE